jgi:hypothetical protein
MEAGYEPVQPIPFSHKTHAGDMQIACLYCHSQADRGALATVPPLSTCMKCHDQVTPRDDRGNLKPGIETLLAHWERREPVAWEKVNDLADFVYFDHSRHVNAGVSCQECHGPVETMERVRREYGLKMSWCLDCHRQPAADAAATKPAEPDPDRSGPDAGRINRGIRAPIHCTACHR